MYDIIFSDNSYFRSFTFEASNDNFVNEIVELDQINNSNDSILTRTFSNENSYRFYRFNVTLSLIQWGSYLGICEIEFYEKTGELAVGDPVITGSSLGIPNDNAAAILSASFNPNTTETDPLPQFEIDNSYFAIENLGNGLGKLQVSDIFNSFYNNLGPTQASANVTYTTQNGTQGPTTPITINITENFGPDISNVTLHSVELNNYQNGDDIFTFNSVTDA